MSIVIAVGIPVLLLCAGLPALRARLDRSAAPHAHQPVHTHRSPEPLDEWRPRVMPDAYTRQQLR